jgi:hypothetical protein
MDTSVSGPDDEVWLNHARIDHILSLGGSFGGNIFIKSDRDYGKNHKGDEERETCINQFYFGHSSTDATAQVGTTLSGDLHVYKATIDAVTLRHFTANNVSFEKLKASHKVEIDYGLTKEISRLRAAPSNALR